VGGGGVGGGGGGKEVEKREGGGGGGGGARVKKARKNALNGRAVLFYFLPTAKWPKPKKKRRGREWKLEGRRDVKGGDDGATQTLPSVAWRRDSQACFLERQAP